VDGFSKFVWLYPTKSTGTEEVLEKLEKQAAVFGNPRRIVIDRGTVLNYLTSTATVKESSFYTSPQAYPEVTAKWKGFT